MTIDSGVTTIAIIGTTASGMLGFRSDLIATLIANGGNIYAFGENGVRPLYC